MPAMAAEAAAVGAAAAATPRGRGKKRKKQATDDPEDPSDPYYLAPELIWWYTEQLPNRFRNTQTWKDLVGAVTNGQVVTCLADGCDRFWEVTAEHDVKDRLNSLWSHFHSRVEKEKDWEDKWHPDDTMMKQYLACYKRGQMAEKEAQREAAQQEDEESQDGEEGEEDEEQEEETSMGIQPPEVLPGKRGSWIRKDGWTGESLF